MIKFVRFSENNLKQRNYLCFVFQFPGYKNTSQFGNFRTKIFKKFVEKRLKKYYGTHRYKSFKHDHWRETLSLKTLQEINSNSDCQKVLRLLSYKP